MHFIQNCMRLETFVAPIFNLGLSYLWQQTKFREQNKNSTQTERKKEFMHFGAVYWPKLKTINNPLKLSLYIYDWRVQFPPERMKFWEKCSYRQQIGRGQKYFAQNDLTVTKNPAVPYTLPFLKQKVNSTERRIIRY